MMKTETSATEPKEDGVTEDEYGTCKKCGEYGPGIFDRCFPCWQKENK